MSIIFVHPQCSKYPVRRRLGTQIPLPNDLQKGFEQKYLKRMGRASEIGLFRPSVQALQIGQTYWSHPWKKAPETSCERGRTAKEWENHAANVHTIRMPRLGKLCFMKGWHAMLFMTCWWIDSLEVLTKEEPVQFPETHMDPGNKSSQKEKVIFQPIGIFRCELLVY